jgi:formate dehydrogenase iron-sulfur subunit
MFASRLRVPESSMVLPLLKRATKESVAFTMTRHTTRELSAVLAARSATYIRAPGAPVERMPARAPEPGEQYRFHVDMARCIGCKCCVVACNEQNGNPAAINWRRVGEIEGGWYPRVSRSYLSMGCNHCLEPTCLQGCPVDAYTKDPLTGIVRHSADACIGCQYCTWNCSYGVPQFNPERGVVGKCDMCHGRLMQGQTPACVSACPEGAIRIEIVNVAEWRVEAAAAAAPAAWGLPVGDGSLSSTRVTIPDDLPPNAKPRDITEVTPAEPHWPLVIMTVLTQLSAGAFATIWLLEVLGLSSGLAAAAVSSLAVGGLALAASTLHLGRPIHAYRALRMWRRSWLSREVLLFSVFAAAATTYAGMLWFAAPGAAAAGGVTVALGAAGVTASGWIYRVVSRPAWNTPFTLVEFHLTAATLGPLFALAAGAGDHPWLVLGAASMAGAQLGLLAVRILRFVASDVLELRSTARLLSTTLSRLLLARTALLAVGAVVLPLLVAGSAVAGPDDLLTASFSRYVPIVLAVGCVLALAGELLGRHLFFVSVVPRHMTAPYIAVESEAA